MNSSEIEQAKIAFSMLLRDKERIQNLISTERLKVHKAADFIIKSYLNGTLDSIDFEMYASSVKLAHTVFLKVLDESKPIHGNFYNDLRQRYFDLLNCEPVENSSEPLQDSHLAWMLTELSNDTMSETKKHRWLGYIQGCMAFRGLVTVNDERDATRDVFKGK